MDMNGLQPGQLVKSRAGRDRDRYFLIYNVNGNVIRVVDGDLRKVENPKRKNLKHLVIYPKIAPELTEKFQRGRKVSDTEIKKALEGVVNSVQTGCH